VPFDVPVGRRAAVAGGAAARPVGLPRVHTPLARRIGQVAEHTWLDRLLRSRGWIVLVAIGLIGLVFMQVSLLKLNSGMGRAVERSATLERGNALLRAKVSQLESNDRIQLKATEMGMVLPTSDGVRYLGRDGKRIGGGSATQVPSQGEASTALLPTVPNDATEQSGTPSTTDAVPQTTSSVPGAAAAQAAPPVQAPAPTAPQTQAPAAPAAPAAPSTAATGTATGSTGMQSQAQTQSQTGAATPAATAPGVVQTGTATGGATPGA
jgi:hypothetical protein